MPNANDLTVSDLTNRISILLKSPFGFGKTLAAVSMAVEGPVWLAYWDKKLPVELFAYLKRRAPEILKNIEYDIYGAHNANEYLNKLIKIQKRCDYFGVINDSATNMTSAAVNWSLGFRNVKGGPKMDELNSAAMATIPGFDEYKVETGLVTQALDICRTLPCNVIWTCHPLPSLKVEQAGNTIKVAKVNNIVTYGSKVGAIIPGNFTEIYHFSLDSSWDSEKAVYKNRRIVNTVGVGDEFAKTALELPAELDITDRLFWPIWKEAVQKSLGGFENV